MADAYPCAKCGHMVETLGYTYGRASRVGNQVTPHATEQGKCPTCGSELVRDVLPGEGWKLAGA